MKLLFILLLFYSAVFANWKTDREELEEHYISEPFRIFYSTKNKHKLTNIKDNNKNNIPDYIENIYYQLYTANNLLKKTMNLKEPLQNKNYKNKARYIDVHILKLKHNGLAGDAILKYDYTSIDNNAYSISMSLSNKLSRNNLTPLHELVHIYQNGYTKIKNRWVTEGIARLLEDLMKKNKTKSEKLPTTQNKLNKLISKTYDNASFFKRFTEVCRKKIFIKTFFEELSLQDIEVEKKYNYKKMDWKEKDQKSSKNNPFIFRALQKTINKICPNNNQEIQSFYKLINQTHI